LKVIIEISKKRLEPGRHIERRPVETLEVSRVDIPDEECKEVRPDWGEYRPLVTFPAIERALRSRGLLPWVGPDIVFYFGIAK
jgi:hypothetical protein